MKFKWLSLFLAMALMSLNLWDLVSLAFLVVPMVGAFFIDIVNALVIKLYLLLPLFGG